MKVTVVLEQDDFYALHDVIFDVYHIKPTNEQIQKIWNALPSHITGTAIEWGTDDTVFRDNFYTYLKDNKFKFKEVWGE